MFPKADFQTLEAGWKQLQKDPTSLTVPYFECEGTGVTEFTKALRLV